MATSRPRRDALADVADRLEAAGDIPPVIARWLRALAKGDKKNGKSPSRRPKPKRVA